MAIASGLASALVKVLESPLFLEDGAVVAAVGLIKGLGRARLALASAVVLRFFRGTLLVATMAGLALGVVVFFLLIDPTGTLSLDPRPLI
jgi:hypothetical protein